MRTGLFCIVLVAALGAGLAQAQDSAENEAPLKKVSRPKAAKPAAPKPADAKDATKAKPAVDPLADIPAEERRAIRAALLWAAGEEAARADGQTVAAITAFRNRNKSKTTGPLTAQERGMLLAAARSHQNEFGWTVVTDPATGIRIGLPAKLVPHARLADQGTRWSSRHGDVQVETFRFKSAEPLNAIYERMKKEPSSRKVEYSAMRPDNFIISGLQGLRKFSVRAFVRDGEVRGFVMQFDQAMEGIVAPVMVAMASAFTPFPGQIAPFAALTRPVEYGTGVVVSAEGHIVTDSKLVDGCKIVATPGVGSAEPIAIDRDRGLALLRVYGRRGLATARLASIETENSDLTLIGVLDPHIQDGGTKHSEVKARLSGAAAIELREPAPVAGFSGAAAVDGKGQVVGIMETRNIVLASTEPSTPPVRFISAGDIRAFLATNNVPPANNGGDARSAIVRVICVKN